MQTRTPTEMHLKAFFFRPTLFLPDSSPASPSLSPTDVQCISFAPNLIRLHNSNSTSLCLLIGLDAFLWSWSAADETGKLRTYRGAVLTVRVGGGCMILSHRRLLSSGTNFTRIWRCSEPNMGAVYWVQASFSKELRQMKKTPAKAKTDHWTPVQFFFGHTPPPSLKHFQRPASPCIWR